ncbi:hypothetical protein ACP4OV_024385 [Aristida adscensionis]
MWGGVMSLVPQGLRRRRRRTARVVDESALAGHGDAADDAVVEVVGRHHHHRDALAAAPSALARALLEMARGAAGRLHGEGGGAAAEEAWASSEWRPAGEASHLLMVREGMRYAIYA